MVTVVKVMTHYVNGFRLKIRGAGGLPKLAMRMQKAGFMVLTRKIC